MFKLGIYFHPFFSTTAAFKALIYFCIFFYIINGCCEICGPNYVEFEGRCLDGELIRGELLQSTKDPFEYPDTNKECCKLCGIPTEKWESDNPTFGSFSCNKPKQHNLKSSHGIFENLKCQACKGMINVISGCKDLAMDAIQDTVTPYCNGLLLFRGICKYTVRNTIESIVEHINNGMSNANICGKMLNLCPHNHTLRHNHLKNEIIPINEVMSSEDILALEEWSFLSLNAELNISNEHTLQFMARHQLISNTQICPKCHPLKMMTLIQQESSRNKYQWQCTACNDDGKIIADTFISHSPEYNSVFSGVKARFDDIVRVMYLWAKTTDYTILNIAKESGITSHNVLIDLFQHIRDVCQNDIYSGRSDYLVTGNVEIYESIFYKDIYKRSTAHHRTHNYVFIFFETETLQYHIETVERISLDTFAKSINAAVDPSSATIYSNLYDKFGGIKAVKAAIKKLAPESAIIISNDTVPAGESGQKWHRIKTDMHRLQKVRRQLSNTYIYQYIFKRVHHDHGILQHLMVAIKKYTHKFQQSQNLDQE